MTTIMITGGTGLVGKALTERLVDGGFSVIVLTRKIPDSGNQHPGISYALWDIKKKSIDIPALQQADHIIHLAGAGVMDKKWTDEYKQEIIDSRTKSSELIIEALKNNSNKVKTVVSASATGWYTANTEATKAHANTEDEPADNSFLGEVCRLWEAGIEPVKTLGKRLIKFRTGIVLSNKGGALKEFKTPLKFGVASILGNGKQIVSWIHIDDLCSMFIGALENEELSGAYNAVAPNPVTNKELTLVLAKEMKGKFFIPMHVPAFVLKLMLGGRSIEILKSNNVSAEKILKTGFTFRFTVIEKAMKDLIVHG